MNIYYQPLFYIQKCVAVSESCVTNYDSILNKMFSDLASWVQVHAYFKAILLLHMCQRMKLMPGHLFKMKIMGISTIRGGIFQTKSTCYDLLHFCKICGI